MRPVKAEFKTKELTGGRGFGPRQLTFNSNIGRVFMNAYCNARIESDGSIWLSASYNTAGLKSGDVEYQINGKKFNDAGFDWNPRKPISPADPPGPPMSETYTTDNYNGKGASVRLDAEEDAFVMAYVDGKASQDNSAQGRKHYIKWIADEERWFCYIETRVNGAWVRDPDYDGCKPTG